MLPYLHILIRVEDDGSLNALGAFTNKKKLTAYQKATGLEDSKIRLDFYNGPFEKDIEVIYAGHRRWNMDRFQLGGYFKTEGEAWDWVSQDGYVSVLRIDVSYEEEKQFEDEALKLYAKLQKRWRLTPYQHLVASVGADKARANITLRFYEDALESLKPKPRKDVRPLYALWGLALLMPIAAYFYTTSGPEYDENAPAVTWLPSDASNISYYRSKRVEVYEFNISAENFKTWASQNGMLITQISEPETLSRYNAYTPTYQAEDSELLDQGSRLTPEQFEEWKKNISVTIESGILAVGSDQAIAAYDQNTQRAYFERLVGR